jgi:hypothetical protein
VPLTFEHARIARHFCAQTGRGPRRRPPVSVGSRDDDSLTGIRLAASTSGESSRAPQLAGVALILAQSPNSSHASRAADVVAIWWQRSRQQL